MSEQNVVPVTSDELTQLAERGDQPQSIYLRTAAGRVHRGVVSHGQVLVSEGCNLDDAPGREEVITDLAEVELGALCERCFPKAGR